MTAYYNEIDKDAAAWLRELIKAGRIAPGIVDERSIEDVTPADLAPFTQCHFFAGLGIWSLALRAAGVADDFPIWSGSCPCQPFSSAGKGGGFDDERHLWPHWHYLISQRRPAAVIGEQVASSDAGPWVDLIHTDLEALGYAFGAVPFPSAGIGAPHIRDRLYWVALGDPCREGLEGHRKFGNVNVPQGREAAGRRGAAPSVFDGLAIAGSERHDGRGIAGPTGEPVSGRSTVAGHSAFAHGLADTGSAGSLPSPHAGIHRGQSVPGSRDGESERPGAIGGLDDSQSIRPRLCDPANIRPADGKIDVPANASYCEFDEPFGQRFAAPTTGPTNGFWRAADWLFCRDGKWRPVEPGTQPLAYGMPRSMGALSPELQRLAEVAGLSNASLKRAKAYRTSSLRGYGNAINAEAARLFIKCCLK